MNKGRFDPFYFHQPPVDSPVFPFDQQQEGEIVNEEEEGVVIFFVSEYFFVDEDNDGKDKQYTPTGVGHEAMIVKPLCAKKIEKQKKAPADQSQVTSIHNNCCNVKLNRLRLSEQS